MYCKLILLKEKMKIFSYIVNLFYPNYCLHCFSKIEKKYFCNKCINFFSFIYPKKRNYFAVFEKKGPINTFLKEIKKQQIFGLFKLAGCFIVVQHYRLNWQIPDIIIPVSKNKLIKNHIYYLSKEVAKLFNRPMGFESNKNQIALFIEDVFDIKNIEKIKSYTQFKKMYYISLCFDIFFDNFYLSE